MDENLIKRDTFCPYFKAGSGISYCLGGNCGIYDKQKEQCGMLSLIQSVGEIIEVEKNERN